MLHQTVLHDYYFLWGKEQQQAAIALGFGSLYNHCSTPNAHYLADYDHLTFDFIALRDIEAGEEITVDYRGEAGSHKRLWFRETS